ncbi:MAG: PAS domain S-box protein [Deltaproteobacteria bacterium]|nr:PAS domain S-box protein [Deltaproteobacteria bacterium]MBW2137081.1 PAS domain S-box protein [Deltaproteobacteria bacterium]
MGNNLNAAIVGGGKAGLAVIDMLTAQRHRPLQMDLIGVADINPEAPGARRARRLGIYTTTDYHDLFGLKDLNLIMELTGDPETSKSIQEEKPVHIHFMDHTVSKLFWDIMHLEKEKLIPESEAKAQIKAVSRLFMDMINVEEEKLRAEKEAEERIKAERDNTARILDGLVEAVVVMDKDHRIENSNETFLELFGDERETILGKRCFEVIFHREAPCDSSFCPIVELAANPGKIIRKELMFSENGQERYYEANYSALKDDQGAYTRCLISMSDITHRKRLELDLENSRRKYKNLFQTARDGIVLFDLQGRIIETNVTLRQMLGYSRRELESMKVAQLTTGPSSKILSDHLEDLEIMGSVSAEMDFVKRNGDSLPVESSISWLSEDGIFQGLIRDISVRKKLEESRKLYSERLEKEVEERTKELRASQQETLRQKKYAEGILYGSPIPMFVLDRNHKITYWNRALEKLTNFSSEEMIGTDNQWKPFYPHKRPLLADLIIENDIETIHKLYDGMHLRKSTMVEGAYEAEHYFEHLGEGGTYLYFNAAPIKDDAGEIQGAIITYQDFTQRVRMTQELRRREAFVQNLIQNSIDGIIATDLEGKIVIFNRAAEELLGYSPESIIGKMKYQEILSRETVKDIRKAFYSNAFGPEGKIINMQMEFLDRAGNPIPVRLSGTLLYEEGKEVGSVVSIQDLREILRLQKEKEQAERMAAIGQTVAGLAHYIKNILNGLKGGAYVINSAMKKRNLDLMANGWRIVEKNIDQISHIVMDMLVYSKDRQPEYEMVDPNELALDVLELMKDRAKSVGVTLIPDLMEGLEPVSMDRTAIHRCLLNLVSNAIDACTMEDIMSGEARVTVKTDKPRGWAVRFQVRDNGAGMDEKVKQKLFTGFFSTKGNKGTGLGLPVTQKIVKEHKGQLSFESEVGKGTTFSLCLPEV